MGFEVAAGEDLDTLARRRRRAELLLRLGAATLTIPLNGGSEERAVIRDHWRDFARALDIGFRCVGGCLVAIGGPPTGNTG
jgi:hypothetical protein